MKRLALAASLLLVAGCTLLPGSSGVEFDHTVEGAASDPDAADVGPDLGQMQVEWRVEDIEVTAGGGESAEEDPQADAEALAPPVGFAVSAGALVVTTRQAALAYDAATGEELWSYREPGREILSATTEDTVVLATQDPDDAQGPEHIDRLVGLDAASGELLWELEGERRVGADVLDLNAAGGVVPLLESSEGDGQELSGLDARTGEVAWTADYPDCGGADLGPPQQSDGSLVLMWDGSPMALDSEGCADETQLTAFAADTGEQLWRHGGPFEDRLFPAGHINVAEETVYIRRLGEDGADELLRIEDGEAAGALDVPGRSGPLMGGYWPADHPDEEGTILMDVETGDTVSEGWPRLLRPDGTAPSTLDGEDTVYGFSPHALPVPALSVGGAASGEPRAVPLPGPSAQAHGAIWVEAVGELLLVARDTAESDFEDLHVVAYSSQPTEEPVELGGVTFADWPELCELELPDLENATGENEARERPLNLGTEQRPREECRIEFDDPDDDTMVHDITAWVRWVAPDAETAEAWFDGEPTTTEADEVADHATHLQARIGRVLVGISEYQHTPVDVEEVLDALAEELAEH